MSGSLRVLFDAVHAAVEMVKSIVIKMLAAAVKEDVALAQRDDAFAIAQGVIHLVQRDDHGDAVGLINVAQGIHYDACGFRVQRGNRLVGQDHFGLLHQRPGDSDALLLPARKRGNALIRKVRHANAG